jgi:hypothetical protein
VSQKIILNDDDKVSCPACETAFPVQAGLSHHLIEQYEAEYSAMLDKERESLEKRVIQEQQRKIAKVHESELQVLKQQLKDSQLAEAHFKKQIEAASQKAAERIRTETSLELKSLKDEMASKDKRLSEFRDMELLLRKEKKAVEQQKEELTLEV